MKGLIGNVTSLTLFSLKSCLPHMVLREIIDSKISSLFIVFFQLHKNASSQGNTSKCVSYASICILSTSVMTPRFRQENDGEGQVWRKETLNNNGWFIAYSESYLGHTFEGPHFSTLLILELIKFSYPLFCFSFSMQLETQRWQAEWCTSEQRFFLRCVKELSAEFCLCSNGTQKHSSLSLLHLALVLLIQTSSTSSSMRAIQISLRWPIELEVFPPTVLI